MDGSAEDSEGRWYSFVITFQAVVIMLLTAVDIQASCMFPPEQHTHWAESLRSAAGGR